MNCVKYIIIIIIIIFIFFSYGMLEADYKRYMID